MVLPALEWEPQDVVVDAVADLKANTAASCL